MTQIHIMALVIILLVNAKYHLSTEYKYHQSNYVIGIDCPLSIGDKGWRVSYQQFACKNHAIKQGAYAFKLWMKSISKAKL